MDNYIPDMYKKSVFDIDYSKLKSIGIKCLVFDLDNTLALIDEEKISPLIKEKLQRLKKDFKIAIISNNTKKRIMKFCDAFDTFFVPFAMKPLGNGFKKVIKKYSLTKKEICIIGDQLMTDVWGGKRFGIYTILVDPLGEKDLKITTLNRFFERRINIMDDKFCIGCGVKLQTENVTAEGYTTNIENDICSRCFRMKNYGEYQIVTRSNDEYIEILKSVNDTKDLVIYVIDLLNISKDINLIREYFDNKVLLVLNKRDILPKSIKDEKIIDYFKKLGLDYQDIVIISPKKNYNIDELISKVKKYKTSKNVYVVGHTNVGKSTLINTLMKNYSEYDSELTISPLPSTTLNKINIKLNSDLTLIDTPGLVDNGNILNYVSSDVIKKISPKKEIKPKTYQLKKGQCLIIGDLFRVDYVEGDRNSFTVFASNELKIKRYNMYKHNELKNLFKHEIKMQYHEDLVINGLGFVKIVEEANINVYIDKDVEVFTRASLI